MLKFPRVLIVTLIINLEQVHVVDIKLALQQESHNNIILQPTNLKCYECVEIHSF